MKKTKVLKKGNGKKKLRTVQSGIGISGLDKDGNQSALPAQSFLTSRTARVLLAGAGFLADAVSIHILLLISTFSSFLI